MPDLLVSRQTLRWASLISLLFGWLILGSHWAGNPLNYGYFGLTLGAIAVWGFLITIREERPFLLAALGTAIGLRCLILLVTYDYLSTINGMPFLFAQSGDDHFYHSTAVEIGAAWNQGRAFRFPDLYGLSGAYYQVFPFINALLYHTIGASPLTMRLLNLVVGTISCLLVYLIAKRIFDAPTARVAAALMVVSPDLLFWGATQYKDTLLVFLILVALWCFLEWERTRRNAYVLATLATLVVAGTIRFPSVLQALLLGGIYLYFTRFRKHKGVAFAFVAGLLAVLVAVGFLGSDYLAFLSDPARILAKFTQRFDFVANLIDPRVLLLGMLALPFVLLAVFLIPVPLIIQLASPFAVINQYLLPGAIAWHLMVPFFAAGLWQIVRERHSKGALLVGWVGTTMITLLVSFLILTLRHRLQMLPFQLMLAAYGMVVCTQHTKAGRAVTVYYLLLPVLVLAYNLLRLRYGSSW